MASGFINTAPEKTNDFYHYIFLCNDYSCMLGILQSRNFLFQEGLLGKVFEKGLKKRKTATTLLCGHRRLSFHLYSWRMTTAGMVFQSTLTAQATDTRTTLSWCHGTDIICTTASNNTVKCPDSCDVGAVHISNIISTSQLLLQTSWKAFHFEQTKIDEAKWSRNPATFCHDSRCVQLFFPANRFGLWPRNK